MASKKTVKRTVAHANLYLMVDGKLQHVPQGSELTLSEEDANSIGDKLVAAVKVAKVDLSESKSESVD